MPTEWKKMYDKAGPEKEEIEKTWCALPMHKKYDIFALIMHTNLAYPRNSTGVSP